jgi:dTDP-4-amino-4,6-dideoxygalactose transaminase
MEGGAITTNDDGLAKRLRRLRNFGFAGFDTVVSVGTNGKMSEAATAMGHTPLESCVTPERRRHECRPFSPRLANGF